MKPGLSLAELRTLRELLVEVMLREELTGASDQLEALRPLQYIVKFHGIQRANLVHS